MSTGDKQALEALGKYSATLKEELTNVASYLKHANIANEKTIGFDVLYSIVTNLQALTSGDPKAKPSLHKIRVGNLESETPSIQLQFSGETAKRIYQKEIDTFVAAAPNKTALELFGDSKPKSEDGPVVRRTRSKSQLLTLSDTKSADEKPRWGTLRKSQVPVEKPSPPTTPTGPESPRTTVVSETATMNIRDRARLFSSDSKKSQKLLPPQAISNAIDKTGGESSGFFANVRKAANRLKQHDEPESTPKTESSSPQAPKDGGQAPERRGYIAKELLDTERNYNRDLKLIKTHFLDKIKKNNILNASDIKAVFSQLEVIINVSDMMLLDLADQIEAKKTNLIGKVFVTLGEILKTYAFYVNNYDESIKTLQAVKKSNKKFNKLCSEVEQSGVTRGLSLDDLLIIVVQRLPRYVLLLTDLLKCTPETHPDYSDLNKGLQKIRETADHVNKSKSDSDKLTYSLQIHNVLGIKDIPSHRSFIHECTLHKTAEEENAKTFFQLYIFNDLVILVKFGVDETLYWFKMFALVANQLVPFLEKGIVLVQINRSFFAEDIAARDLLLEKLKFAVEENADREENLKRMRGSIVVEPTPSPVLVDSGAIEKKGGSKKLSRQETKKE